MLNWDGAREGQGGARFQPELTRVSAGTPLLRGDEEIKHDLLFALADWRQRSAVEIDVERGCVTLTGKATSTSVRREIEDEAAAVFGVRMVVSYLEIA